jgi:heptosyltransferase-2
VKILVRATNWIGDAVMSLPVVRALRERYPEAQITVLAKPWVADLYLGEPSIDALISLAGAPGMRDLGAKWRQAGELRRAGFDLAVLLPNSFESAALVFAAGVKRRVGYARDARAWMLTDAIARPKPSELPKHERYYYPELLRRTGILERLPEISEIRFAGIQEARQRGQKLLAGKGLGATVVGVSPGAAFGGAKRWIPERFAAAAREIAGRTGGQVAVFGSAAERLLCEEVASAARGINFAGETSLREFIDMTAACQFFLANDSGAMHIAAALGIPSITVFGPTDETATGPCSFTADLVRVPVECAPCKLRECPIDHRCMTGVSTELVVARAFEVLGPQ